jgi:hypothetical protein
MDQWTTLADDQTIKKTIEALKANGIDAAVVENKDEAKKKILDMIPEGAEIFQMTSVTLDTISLSEAINNSGKYDAVRPKLTAMNKETQAKEMKVLGAAPDYAIGSVHAVTEDGKVLIASNTGSQLAAYVYGSSHVIWVVGTQKIVKDFEQGLKRIYEYTLERESERAKKAYGMQKSNVSKLLVVNKEVVPNRITVVFVKEVLGF